MNNSWSIYIIVLVVLNIAGCVWLLWRTSGKRTDGRPADSTSHVWDEDLTEYDKPLPRWWINLFYITIVFTIGYLAWYPGFGSFKGFGDRRAGAQSRSSATRPLHLRGQLRHLPWLGGHRRRGLPQPHR